MLARSLTGVVCGRMQTIEEIEEGRKLVLLSMTFHIEQELLRDLFEVIEVLPENLETQTKVMKLTLKKAMDDFASLREEWETTDAKAFNDDTKFRKDIADALSSMTVYIEQAEQSLRDLTAVRLPFSRCFQTQTVVMKLTLQRLWTIFLRLRKKLYTTDAKAFNDDTKFMKDIADALSFRRKSVVDLITASKTGLQFLDTDNVLHWAKREGHMELKKVLDFLGFQQLNVAGSDYETIVEAVKALELEKDLEKALKVLAKKGHDELKKILLSLGLQQINVAGSDYDTIVKEAVKALEKEKAQEKALKAVVEAVKALELEKDLETALKAEEKPPQPARMVGSMKDLQSGKFSAAAFGLKKLLKVSDDWDSDEECKEEKFEEEVCRLADCAKCAEEQADVLKEMTSEGNAHLLKTSEITARLVNELAALQTARQSARRTVNKEETKLEAMKRKQGYKEEETRLENKVQQTRKEIDEIGGWYYGRKDAPAVAWPESKVKHDWGNETYGQPMCADCKKYGLDHSKIVNDLKYCLHEESSEKVCFNEVRDPTCKGRAGRKLDYFVGLPEAVNTGMTRAEAGSLRFYSSHSFGAVTNPLKDPDRETQHPLAAITYSISTAIRKQTKGRAHDQDAALKRMILWRGYNDRKISEGFQKYGGAELACMSTTTDVKVAVGYALRKSMTDGGLLLRIVTTNDIERGMDLSWISMFPGESERLLPPLTFMSPPQKMQDIEIELEGEEGQAPRTVNLTVVQIDKITAPNSI
jgi:hypothetical protein